jgi:hypothetical protein
MTQNISTATVRDLVDARLRSVIDAPNDETLTGAIIQHLGNDIFAFVPGWEGLEIGLNLGIELAVAVIADPLSAETQAMRAALDVAERETHAARRRLIEEAQLVRRGVATDAADFARILAGVKEAGLAKAFAPGISPASLGAALLAPGAESD